MPIQDNSISTIPISEQNNQPKSFFANKFFLLGLCLGSLVIGIIITLIFVNLFSPFINPPNITDNKNTPLLTTPLAVPTPLPSADAQTYKAISLPKLLKEKCVFGGKDEFDYSINLSLVPFNFGDRLLSRYQLSQDLSCNLVSPFFEDGVRIPMGGFLKFYNREVSEGENGYSISIMSKDSQSENEGVDAPIYDFESRKRFDKKIIKDGVAFYFALEDPGPYGVSDMGLWINIHAYKYLNGYVLAYRTVILDSVVGDLFTLLTPYATPVDFSDVSGTSPKNVYDEKTVSPIYFNNYTPSYEGASLVYKKLMDEVILDLNSVTLK